MPYESLCEYYGKPPLQDGENDWERWGCDHFNCPGSIPVYQCIPGQIGECTCYPDDGTSPAIDDCEYCNFPGPLTWNSQLDTTCQVCCNSSCLGCIPETICPSVSCIEEGTDFYTCCSNAGSDCGGDVGNSGCTDPEAINYCETCVQNDGSCEYAGITGCTDQYASNFLDQAVCNVADPDGCNGTCIPGICPQFDDGSCLYEGYVEPSIDRLWTFTIGGEVSDGEIYTQMYNFVNNGCTSQYQCQDPTPPIGDISNIYYGKIEISLGGEISDNNDNILFAFINNEFRGASFIKTLKGIHYIYLEVKWSHTSESSIPIYFYAYVDGLYYSIDNILRIGESLPVLQPSEVTSDFGLL